MTRQADVKRSRRPDPQADARNRPQSASFLPRRPLQEGPGARAADELPAVDHRAPARKDQVGPLVGADDAHVLWVNGAKVSERQGRHTSEPDDVAVPVDLRKGWNWALLRVANLDGAWAFQLRAADPDGVLRWSAIRGR